MTDLPSQISTQVYFIRHGIAAERGVYHDDSQRPLVEKGRLKTAKIAQRLMELGLEFNTLLTSPFIRATQTSELLCQTGLAEKYQIFEPLAPGGNLEHWLYWLITWQSVKRPTLALVGHEPDLSNWAQQLVHGDNHHQWVLKKAGIIGLEVPDGQVAIGHSQLFWLAPPRLIL
ncbi:phosphohistidine phosphatase SixA [Leptothoe spongobia]|uniref:Phosphohistidine phosphatase SixA n=1 Tax=Leptothoe spongobia TAU-MAC 1115 TaxID=1967444 RepID=A0A947GKE3_9CYAN|nr:phosphohistidine phosphatase SixA [Leptothoe spongobia]MBT9317319.1 phosphohistidine phosphatase SixA [Leptothoe spongobia TAU-MAC 1115]